MGQARPRGIQGCANTDTHTTGSDSPDSPALTRNDTEGFDRGGADFSHDLFEGVTNYASGFSEDVVEGADSIVVAGFLLGVRGCEVVVEAGDRGVDVA